MKIQFLPPSFLGVSFLILSLLSMPLCAENYYVDALSGADSNTGTTPKQPWKTLKNVQKQQFQPGDVIAFHANQVWRGKIRCSASGEEGKPITYTSYGKGAKPAFWGSVDAAHPEMWQEFQPGIWATKPNEIRTKDAYADFDRGTWSCYTEGKGETGWRVRKDENNRNEFTIQCSKGSNRSCDIQLNYASFPIPQGAAFRFRFKASLTRNASKKNVLDAEKSQALLKTATLIKSSSPWPRYGSCVSSSVREAGEWTEFEMVFTSDQLEDVKDGRISFFIGDFLPDDCEFTFVPLGAKFVEILSCGLSNEVGNIIMKKKGSDEELAAWKRWDVESLKDEGDFYFDIPSARLFFKSEKNPAEIYSMMEAAGKCNLFDLGTQQHIIVDGFSFAYSGGHGLRGGGGVGCKHCIVRNNDFLWIGGSWLYTRGPIPTRYGNGIEFWSGNEDLLIENNYFYQIYDTAMTNQGPDSGVLKEIVWRGNRCEKCEQCYEIWLTSPEMTVESLTVEDSSFQNSGFGWSHAQRPDKRATHFLAYGFNAKIVNIEYRNNDLGPSAQKMLWFSNTRTAEFNIHSNRYTGSADAPLFNWAGLKEKDGVTFEKYRELTGNDKDSTLRNK